MDNNEEIKKYRVSDLKVALIKARNEQGLSLREVVEIIKEVFTKEEVGALVKELK